MADPAQRTAWNIRASDAILMIVDAQGLPVSSGTRLAADLAADRGKPLWVADLSRPEAVPETADWLSVQLSASGEHLALGIGGSRETEAPGIYENALKFLHAVLDRASGRP